MEILGRHFGEKSCGIGLELFEEDAVTRDLAESLTIRAARDRHRNRTARTVAGKSDHAHVVAEVLAAKLCADSGLLGEGKNLCFEIEVTESMSSRASARRKRIEVSRAREFGGLDGVLGRRSTDDDRKVIRRTRCGAERLHLLEQPGQQGLFVQQGLRLLEEITLVRRAATLGEEEELVLITIDCVDLDFRREVRIGVAFLIHRNRCELAVAKVAREIGVVDAAGDRLFVATTGEHELTLLRLHDRRAGVLAHRKHTTRCNSCVLQEIEGDEAIVRARFWVGEDVGELLEVARAEQVCNVAHRSAREQGQCRVVDAKEFAERRGERVDAVGAEESVFRRVGTERQQFGVREWRWLGGGHLVSQPLALRRAPAFP